MILGGALGLPGGPVGVIMGGVIGIMLGDRVEREMKQMWRHKNMSGKVSEKW